MSLSQENILQIFRRTHALLEGHFLLTSGLHSTEYFQCAKVLQHPPYAELLCREIALEFATVPIAAVIAPAQGGIVVSQEVGRQLSATTPVIRTLFAERFDGTMKLRRGFELGRGEQVLVCEDVITTGGSVGEVVNIVRSAGAHVAGVACIVDRSGGAVKLDVPRQFAVLRMDAISYKAAECPLCKQGVPLEKPGSRGLS